MTALTYPLTYTPADHWLLIGSLRPSAFYCLDCEPDVDHLLVTKVKLFRLGLGTFSQSCKGCGRLIVQGKESFELWI